MYGSVVFIISWRARICIRVCFWWSMCTVVNNFYILWLSELLFIGSLAQVFFKVVVSFAFMLICADLNPHILS